MSAIQNDNQSEDLFPALRRESFHLGLEPEFTLIERLARSNGAERVDLLRENVDSFFFGRGFEVLGKVLQRAGEVVQPVAAKRLQALQTELHGLMDRQFAMYPPKIVLPHSDIIRRMQALEGAGDDDELRRFVQRNLIDCDGHLFVILGEAMRNARQRHLDSYIPRFTKIGALVARMRLRAGLPCSFARLYGVEE